VIPITFLGTGDYLASERYWNAFVIDRRLLVEPSPTALPHLRHCGLSAADLDVVVLSHFHPDHCFGWPFLLLELVRTAPRQPLFVVGPPGVERFFADLMTLSGTANLVEAARARLDLRFVETDGAWQTAGSLRFRAVEVDHVPHLACFGFLFEVGGRTIGYSGDCKPCPGLDVLADQSEVLVLECNGPHPPPAVHMDVDDVVELRRRFPAVRLVLTHLGAGVSVTGVPDCVLAEDFQTLDL